MMSYIHIQVTFWKDGDRKMHMHYLRWLF